MSISYYIKLLKCRFFRILGLILSFIYNIVKGKNCAEIVFNEVIVLLFLCSAFKMEKLFFNEQKNLIPGEEGVTVHQDIYISNEEALAFNRRLRLSRIDDNNRPGLRLIKNELDNKFNT